jgi:sterol desaturase/sphingolipid hydroxylase (fatty acid hydroxylase superfamily)
MARFKYILSWALWPLLFVTCMSVAAYGFAVGQPIVYFNVAYVFLIVALWRLEIWMPHERAWLPSDGQSVQSILHTLSSKGTVQGLLIFSGSIGLADAINGPVGLGIWPDHWPLWAQVSLGVVAVEFALYWAHRLGHETALVWRFHAVHHSVTKLWFLNTGRFHFVDSLLSIVMGMGVLMALGAPMEVVMWLSVITAFIGMLTHCNVEMRFGPLNWVFNTPGLHRWHHSQDLREGNRNYGENVMVWDHVFRTYYDADYRPPADIGMKDYMPEAFWKQLIWPFILPGLKKRLEPDFEYMPFVKEDKS